MMESSKFDIGNVNIMPVPGSFNLPALTISSYISLAFCFSVNIIMTSFDDSICMLRNFFASVSPVPRP